MSKYVAFSLLFFDENTYIQKKKNNLFYFPPIINISIDRSNDEGVLRCRTDTLHITCCRTDGSLPVVRLGDVSELLLDGVSVDIDGNAIKKQF